MRTAALPLLLGALACIAAQACARFGYEVVDSERNSETPAAGHCNNQMLDADETDTDCGGQDCADCGEGSGCVASADCASATCQGNVCRAATCADSAQNLDETGTDCGGGCASCPPGNGCVGASDCDSQNCQGSTCQAATCSDAIQNQDETAIDCGGSVCTACGVNTPPLARMTVTPGIGSHDGTATVFQADASATTDREDAPAALTYSWDWDNDGTTDDTGVTSTHTYGAAGMFEAQLTVQDTGGLRSTASFLVIVTSVSNVVLVTTADDENDGGATPASPGGTGLSLREAINFANGAAGRQSILVPSGFSIALTNELPSPSDASGVDIVGDGALLDGSGLGGSDDCVAVTAAQTRLFGLEIQNCSRSPLRTAVNAIDSHFSRLNIHDNGQEVFLNGTNARFGPDNEVSRSADVCVGVVSVAATIDRNFIHDCPGRGLVLTGSSDGTLVLGNVIARSAPGILFGSGANNNTLVHNVLHANSDGINAGATPSGIVMQNNIFSANTGFGMRADDLVFAANDHNDYFGNSVGTCDACSLGTGSLTSDPQYIDAAADDFRLQPTSANINAGIDTGYDVNGPAAGSFNGANPDIGAKESP